MVAILRLPIRKINNSETSQENGGDSIIIAANDIGFQVFIATKQKYEFAVAVANQDPETL